MSDLWMSIEPRERYTRVMLCEPYVGPSLKAMLPAVPAQPGALSQFMQAVTAWYGKPLSVALDADSEDVHRQAERWADYLETTAPENISVAWVSPSSWAPSHGRFLSRMGDFRRAGRLISLAATGRR